MGRLGMGELIIIFAVFVLLFGAKRIPEIAASIGKAIKEFKKASNEATNDIVKGLKDKTDDSRS